MFQSVRGDDRRPVALPVACGSPAVISALPSMSAYVRASGTGAERWAQYRPESIRGSWCNGASSSALYWRGIVLRDQDTHSGHGDREAPHNGDASSGRRVPLRCPRPPSRLPLPPAAGGASGRGLPADGGWPRIEACAGSGSTASIRACPPVHARSDAARGLP